MIDYNKYELMKILIRETNLVYKETLDTNDYVPNNDLEQTYRWIKKNKKKYQRKIDKEDRKYQRQLKKLIKRGKIIDTTSEEAVLLDFEELENVPEENVVVTENSSSGETNQINQAEEESNEQENK